MENSLEISDCIIGGLVIIVQINECKHGKQKYLRGHEDVWILVEFKKQNKVFIESH